MGNLHTTPLVNLLNLIDEFSKENDQEAINVIAFELAYRTYIPFNSKGISFDDLLLEYGYKPKEKDNIKIK